MNHVAPARSYALGLWPAALDAMATTSNPSRLSPVTRDALHHRGQLLGRHH